MALKDFRRVLFPTVIRPDELPRLLNQLVQSLSDVLRPILANTSLDCVKLTSVSLTSLTTTAIPHKLGRVPQEWVITRITGASTIYETARDASFLTLYSSGAVTVDLRVS